MTTDHPLVAKLRRDILPYFVSGERLARLPLYRAHRFYSYSHDLFAAAAGFGLTHPLIQTLSAGSTASLPATLGGNGPFAVALGGVAALAWAVLKVYVGREDAEKRASLARSCAKQLRQVELKLVRALGNADPMAELGKLYEDIIAIVDRHIAEDAWPWGVPRPTSRVRWIGDWPRWRW
jgi:hypothetical protein